ncbi:MAG: RNA polymerase sporulation sigma factor SigH [Actinomycetota bacterium]|nr:RNA polymerase sporulation sigma factor SigH [Actinomycetota bacterium]
MQAHRNLSRTDLTNSAPFSFPQTLSDSELVFAARDGDDAALEFLLDKYKNFVRVKARAYFLIGADWDDLVQEGMIGLYKAIRDYQEGKQSSFKAFAELCITRQIITAIKTATRQKHVPLNSYISLNRPIFFEEESDRLLMDFLSGKEIADPVDLVISGEEMQSMRTSFGEILSDLEAQVLTLYIDGKSYQEIADELKRHVKSIDNALQRVKRKIELHLRSRQSIIK